jgi:hypothetical protein
MCWLELLPSETFTLTTGFRNQPSFGGAASEFSYPFALYSFQIRL